MKNRLNIKTQEAKKAKRGLFSVFLTLGYPNLKTTERLILEFEKSGVDIIELGFPFSDPMADGPTIQFSSQYALDRGVKMKDAFDLVAKLRKKGSNIPIVFFSYLNPIFNVGFSKFVKRAKKAGYDGVLAPDLPVDEHDDFKRLCRKEGLSQVYLVTPTTKDERAKRLMKSSDGFVYYVSVKGVTGARKALPSEVKGHLKRLKRWTNKPLLVGFGVSNAKQARDLCSQGDGVIIGSAIIELIRKNPGTTKPVIRFVNEMVKGVKKKVVS